MDLYAANWNESDNDNTTAAPDGAPEGMAPSGLNNVLRAHQGAIKRFVNQQVPKRTAGSSTAYTLAYDVSPAALVDGMTHLVEFDETNGAGATLNVNGLGAIPLYILKPAGWGAIPASTVINGMVCRVAYHSGSGAYRIIAGQMTAVVSGNDGYSVGPSSTRKQWGQVTVSGLGASLPVTYSVAFSAAAYSVHLTERSDNTKPGYIPSNSATGFTVINPGSSDATYFWSAEGPA